ncbi:MAG TPA: TIGR04222 domain-containing membrane protein [Cyanobacteria bacterium UBA11049]|nr:TIGR04222 domain-containing membrane protein [Cyanobacteria bacterium UBA11049]
MNILHNPLAEMYGSHFLILYGVVILMTLVACWWSVKDPTKNLPLPLIPANPDPYEIAYLRGGERQVMQLVVFDLIGRGYLQVEGKSIERSLVHPDEEKLKPIEREVFDWLSSPLKANQIMSQYALLTDIKQHCQVYQQKLQNRQLLYLSEWQTQAQQVGLIGGTIILGLGGYKLLAALINGHHNVAFLIIMAVFSAIALRFIAFNSPPHLSSCGKCYLQRLQEAFEQLKQKAKDGIPASMRDYHLLVALFGVSALAGTPYDDYSQMFVSRSSYSSSSGGCGSGCSSVSSCGSSCGGGCGGCGGCGG